MKKNSYIVTIISFMFVACQGQPKKVKILDKKASFIALSYSGGMASPSDTQFYYKIGQSGLYKIRAIYVRKQNKIIYDSVVLQQDDYNVARKLIDSLPSSIYDSDKEQIGRPSDANDAPYIHVVIARNDGKRIDLYGWPPSEENKTRDYISIAEKVYFALYNSGR